MSAWARAKQADPTRNIGLVVGKARNGEYRVLWVQNFGAQ